jgi:hypothetical protein
LIDLSDTWGDTWNGNILAFRQGTTFQNFTLDVDGFKTFGPLKFTFDKLTSISIIVAVMG